MRKFFRLFLPIFAIVVSGCAHTVEFNPEYYTIECPKYNAGIVVVVVIDDDTLNKTVVMRSPLVGYAHTWHAKPGVMFWGGPFAMKSAVRFSSLDAYKQILSAIREDLKKELEGCRDIS